MFFRACPCVVLRRKCGHVLQVSQGIHKLHHTFGQHAHARMVLHTFQQYPFAPQLGGRVQPYQERTTTALQQLHAQSRAPFVECVEMFLQNARQPEEVPLVLISISVTTAVNHSLSPRAKRNNSIRNNSAKSLSTLSTSPP